MAFDYDPMAGFQIGREIGRVNSPVSGLGDAIRNILDNARKRGLIQDNAIYQGQEAMALAKYKNTLDPKNTTRGAYSVSPTGVATPVLDPAGKTAVFNTDDRIITANESMSASDAAMDQLEALRIQQMIDDMSQGGGNVIEQSAGAGKIPGRPASEAVKKLQTQGAAQKQQGAQRSAEEEELIKLLDALEQ